MSYIVKNPRISDLVSMQNPVTISEASKRLGWGECSIWMLIRQRKVKWSVRGVRVVVDLRALMAWADRNPEISEKLKGRVGADQKHPLT